MAVCATHHALLDLSRDARPARAVRDHGRDIEFLVSQMIELEDNDLLFAAVDAGMPQQVLDGSLLRLSATQGPVAIKTSPLTFDVVLVVAVVRRGEAGTAPVL